MTTRIAAILAFRTRVIAWLIADMTAIAATDDLRMIHARNRLPHARVVARIAGIRGVDMSERFTGRNRAIVATETTTDYLRVINSYRRPPSRRVVAGLTRICRRDMFVGFSGCRTTIVATDAISRYTLVIECCRSPARRRVARIAGPIRLNVISRFACRRRAVMTARANTRHATVIEMRRTPRDCRMTRIAICRRLYVICWFAGRRRAVMTSRTTACHAAVIEMRRAPRNCGMTNIASARRLHVIRRFAGRRCAVMTACARTHHLRVIDARNGIPCRGVVAGLARIGARDMRRVFRRRRGAVVAADAITDDAGVIETGKRPQTGGVAHLAIIIRQNVCGRFADGDVIVVAAAARAVHRIVIDARHRIPLPAAAMTRFAIGIRINMIRRFPRGRNQTARGMTTRAIARRAFELTAHVTAFARQLRMRAFQRKSGFQMIEISCTRHCCCAHEIKDHSEPSQEACNRPGNFYAFAVHSGDSSQCFLRVVVNAVNRSV